MVEEGGVEPSFFPNFTMQLLPPSYRETLPGSLLILILSTLRKLTYGKH